MPKVKTNSGAKRGLPLPDQEKLKENMLIKVTFLRRRLKAEEKPRSLCYIDCSRHSQRSRFACNQIVGKVSYF